MTWLQFSVFTGSCCNRYETALPGNARASERYFRLSPGKAGTCCLFSKLMEAIVQDTVTDRGDDAARAGARQVSGSIYFTLVSYLSVGEPLAVLPQYVHLRLGMSVAMAGLVIGLQSLATLASRPWVGWLCDRKGAKVSVQWGMAACSASGAAMICAAAFQSSRWLGFAFLIASRLLLGMAVSLGSTGLHAMGHSRPWPGAHSRDDLVQRDCKLWRSRAGGAAGSRAGQALGTGRYRCLHGRLRSSEPRDGVAQGARSGQCMGSRRAFTAYWGGVRLRGGVEQRGLLRSGHVCHALFYASRTGTEQPFVSPCYGIGLYRGAHALHQNHRHYGGFPVAMVSLLVSSVGC